LNATMKFFNAPFIHTKLSAPQLRSGLVARPTLVGELLQESPRHTLTLVCAPAGYGKTTLLGNWIAEIKKTPNPDNPIFCWLSLSESDNEPVLFLGYVVAAFESAGAGLSAEAGLMLQASTPAPAQTILAILINELEKLPRSIYLILDDYQFVSNKTIHEGVAFLLDHMPANVHLVIATRSDPPIPLARLRARGQMIEIRAGDLRFSYTEADCLFNQVIGLGLTPEDMLRLEQRTEGWVAGLQMAALAMKGIPRENHPEISAFIKNFAGSNRYILDYLMEEVLSCQSQEIQGFLYQTSILENLCGPLCDAVTGVGSGQSILEYLERSNLFLVSLDSNRVWYRYHHLFASLLQSRMRQSLPVSTIQELYQRASQWYASQELLNDAIAIALAAPDLTFAADILEQHILTFFYQSEIVQVHRWLELLPAQTLRQHSLLCAVYAASIALLPPFPPESLPAAERWMQMAEGSLLSDRQGSRLTRLFILGIRSYWARFRGEPTEMVRQCIFEALALLPVDSGTSMDRYELFIYSSLLTNLGYTYNIAEDEEAAEKAFIQARQVSNAAGDLFNETASIMYLAEIRTLHGLLGEASTLCREALAYFKKQRVHLGHRVPYSGEIGVKLAEILIEQNELAEAEKLLKENIELAKWTISQNILMRGYLAFARLAEIRGNPTEAFECLDKAEKLSQDSAGLVGAVRTRVWLALSGNNPEFFNLAMQWAQNVSLVEFGPNAPLPEWMASLVFIRLILAMPGSLRSGRTKFVSPGLKEILEWLERQERAMQRRAWAHWEIQLGVLAVLTRQKLGDTAGALAALRHVLELAAPQGYVRIFVEKGQPLLNLLREMESSAGNLLPYIRKLQTAFFAGAGAPDSLPDSGSGLIEALTAREVEILKVLAEGLSNRQIAEKFFLAEGTVKFYVHAILEKMGVHSRTQAILAAKQQGII